MGELDSMVILCFTFWGAAGPFATVAGPFTFPREMSEGSNFSASLSTPVCSVFLMVFILMGWSLGL